MFDANCRLIRLGDHLTIAGGLKGVVVFSIDTDEFTAEFPKADWDYLGRGVLVQTEQAGLVHLIESDDGTEIVDGC